MARNEGATAAARSAGQEAVDLLEDLRGVLAVRLGGARFGVWLDEILEVVRTPPITRLPLSAPDVAGVTSIRGDVVPVLDLGMRLLDEPAARPGRLVLIRHEGSGSLVALLVDDVETLVRVAPDQLEEVPEEAEAAGLPAGYVTGVVNGDAGVITVLHLGRAASPPDDEATGTEAR